MTKTLKQTISDSRAKFGKFFMDAKVEKTRHLLLLKENLKSNPTNQVSGRLYEPIGSDASSLLNQSPISVRQSFAKRLNLVNSHR